MTEETVYYPVMGRCSYCMEEMSLFKVEEHEKTCEWAIRKEHNGKPDPALNVNIINELGEHEVRNIMDMGKWEMIEFDMVTGERTGKSEPLKPTTEPMKEKSEIKYASCPKCGWENKEIPLADFNAIPFDKLEKSIGSLCPECGSVVFTQGEYDYVAALKSITTLSKNELIALSAKLKDRPSRH